MEKQAQVMLRTMQGKLNKTREREKIHQLEMQKALDHTKAAKSQALAYYDRLQQMTAKYQVAVVEKEEILQTMDEKTGSEETLTQRVLEAERIAVDASEQAIEIAETVRRKYEPERLRLKNASEEIERLKKSLRRAQQDLKIAKTPVDSKPSMVFTRSGSSVSFESSLPTTPMASTSTPAGHRGVGCTTERIHRSTSSSCPSRVDETRVIEEYEIRLRRSRQQEQQTRKAYDEATQQILSLEEKVRGFTDEKKNLTDRMGSLRERNRQLQALLERQQLEFDDEVNELKQHLRKRKMENHTVFQLWKQSLDDSAPKNYKDESFTLEDSTAADLASPDAPLVAPTPYQDNSAYSIPADSPRSYQDESSPRSYQDASEYRRAIGDESPRSQPYESDSEGSLRADHSVSAPYEETESNGYALTTITLDLTPEETRSQFPLGSLSGCSSPQSGHVRDLGPQHAQDVRENEACKRSEEVRIEIPENDCIYTPKSWVVDLSARPEEKREGDIECEDFEVGEARADFQGDIGEFAGDGWSDPVFTHFGPLSPVIESPDKDVCRWGSAPLVNAGQVSSWSSCPDYAGPNELVSASHSSSSCQQGGLSELQQALKLSSLNSDLDESATPGLEQFRVSATVFSRLRK